MARIKCIKNPNTLGNQIATSFIRVSKFPLKNIDELKNSVLSFLIKTQSNIVEGEEGMDIKDFLSRFKKSFDSSLKIFIEREKNPDRKSVMEEGLSLDWNKIVEEEASPYFTSSKVEPVFEDIKSIEASDEEYDSILELSDTILPSEEVRGVRGYSELILNLIKGHLSKSINEDVKNLNVSQLALDFHNFLKYNMYSVMVDTRATGEDLGFIRDKSKLKEKLKIKMDLILSSDNINDIGLNELLPDIDEATKRPESDIILAKNVLFAVIASNYNSELSALLFQTEEFKWSRAWDATNENSDVYLDTVSKLMFTNSPRLIAKKGLEGEYLIDYDSPVLSESEIKNIVLPKLVNVKDNSIEGIRDELSKYRGNPVINSIYTYYFDNSKEGYLLTDATGNTEKHYSLSYAVEAAYDEAYGSTQVDLENRLFIGFLNTETDLFKNRIISSFISIEEHNRGNSADGKLKTTIEKRREYQQGYKAALIENIELNGKTKVKIANSISVRPVSSGPNTSDIQKIEISILKELDNGFTSEVVKFQMEVNHTNKKDIFLIENLKGNLGRIIPGTLQVDGTVENRNQNINEALSIMGFQWATNPKFLKEYNNSLANSGHYELSIENLVANLALINALNSPARRKEVVDILKNLKTVKSYNEINNISEGLEFNPNVYLNKFFDRAGPVTEAMSAVHSFQSSINVPTDDGTRAAATVGITLSSKKDVAILDAQDIIKNKGNTILEGNLFIQGKGEITGSYVKQGTELNGNILLLKDMSSEDRVISLIEQGLGHMAFSDGTNLRSTVVQPHQYADKTSPKNYMVAFDSELITLNKNGDINKRLIKDKIIRNYKRKYNNLSRYIHDQWKKTLITDWTKTSYFVNPSSKFINSLPLLMDTESGIMVPASINNLGEHIAIILNEDEPNLNKLDTLLQELNIDSEYVIKNIDLIDSLSYTIKSDGSIGIKETSKVLQTIFNDGAKAKKLINYHNNNFIGRLLAKIGTSKDLVHEDIKTKIASDLGKSSPLSDREAIEMYHLIHQLISPQVEELSIGDSSQFEGDMEADAAIDFTNLENKFDSAEDFEFSKLMYQLDIGQSKQNANKSKRSSLLLTNGQKIATIANTKKGIGVGKFFNTAVIEDTVLIKKILTGIKELQNYDGIRIGLDLVRRQINASIGNGALSSYGEAHKDSYTWFDVVSGAYKVQKMSTMYMTPEFIDNSDLAHDLIKRMLTSISYPANTTVILQGQTEPTVVVNAWDVLMKLAKNNDLSLSNDVLWDYFQKTESQNPHIRGQYVSYLTFKTAEKTGSTGIDSSGGYGFTTEDVENSGKIKTSINDIISNGDIFQWNMKGEGNKYHSGTVVRSDDTTITVVEETVSGIFTEKIFEINNNKAVLYEDIEGEENVFFQNGKDVETFHKGFNYSTLDYRGYSIVLKAGKAADFKGGVAKMIQGFNSVLFNKSYIKDALNMVQAQGNIADSNINKLKEDIVMRTMEKILTIESIPGIPTSEIKGITKQLNYVKYLLTTPPPADDSKQYKLNEKLISDFLSIPQVQTLGLKSFIADNSKNSYVSDDMYAKMTDDNYNFSFSSSATDLMVKTFSTYIEQETIKNRFNGGMMILSPAEDFLKLFEYDGASMTRKALVDILIKKGEIELVSEYTKDIFNVEASLTTNIIKFPHREVLLSIQEFIDSNLDGNSDMLYEALINEKAMIVRLDKYDTRKLKHTEVKSKDGLIEDTQEYKTFIKFQKLNISKKLAEDQFNIYKYIQESEGYAEYDFFAGFSDYSSYSTAFDKFGLEPNYDFISLEAIDKFKWYIDQNKIIIGDKVRLAKPITINILNTLVTDNFNLDTFTLFPEYEAFKEIVTYIKENNILVNEAWPIINFKVVSDPSKSDTHATVQENVLKKIAAAEKTAKAFGINLVTPSKVVKSNLIEELQSITDTGESKYSSSDSEIIIPFIYAKEFGLNSKKLPSINEIIGNPKTEKEAIQNAETYFLNNSNVNFNIFNLRKVKKITGESEIDHGYRALIEYKKELLSEKASVSAGSGPLNTKLEGLINLILTKTEALLNIENDMLFLEELNIFNLKVLNTVRIDTPYVRNIKLQRAKSFIEYLKVYYGRIPGTGLQTNGAGITVGFIQDMGNTAYLSSLNALITGSDFDIDKITMIVRAIDNNGIAYSYDEWIDESSPVNTIVDEFLNDATEFSTENVQNFVKTIKNYEFDTKLENYIDRLNINLLNQNNKAKLDGELNLELTTNEIKIILNTAKKSYRKRFEKGMQNYILDQMRMITKGVNVQFEAQTMVHMDNITEAKNIVVNQKIDYEQSKESKYYNLKSLSSFDLFGHMRLETENFAGKESVGPFANAQKALALILHNINTLKQRANENGFNVDDIGKFKKEINLVLERKNENIIRTSTTFVNLPKNNSVTGQEDAAIKKAINDYRQLPENKKATILDISRFLATAESEDTINLKDAWKRKMLLLTEEQGWESIGEFIQSATDNAKVLNLGPIGANQDTNSYFAFSLMAGFNIYDTVEFLSNPKIKTISNIYNNFSKSVHTDLDLKAYFGTIENIPREFRTIFNLDNKNTIIREWPRGVKKSISALNSALIQEAIQLKKDSAIYKSFSQLIEGEEELRVLFGFIGLDSKHPNNLYDSVNKFRSIGSNIRTIINRNRFTEDLALKKLFYSYEEVIKSPVALAYKYTTDEKFKEDINKLLSVNISYIDGLDIIKNNGPFSTYLSNLGYKMESASKLSYTPLIYLDKKFSGWKKPTYKEYKILERFIQGLSIRTYLEKNDYAKNVKSVHSDKEYNLTDDKSRIQFLIDFRHDVEVIKENNTSNAFINYLKLDKDYTKQQDVYTDNKYYNLYISSNATDEEKDYIKTALNELNSSKATENEKLFYKNLQLYSLLIDSGLIQKNGIFQFLYLDMEGYNDHLESILNDDSILDRLRKIDSVSVHLNVPYLIPEIDTSKGTTKKENSAEYEYYNNLEDQFDYDEAAMDFTEQGTNVRVVKGDNETNIDQRIDLFRLYRSTNSQRVYYQSLPRLQHSIVTPIKSPLGTLPKFDNEIDPILNAGWQHGIPLNYQGNTIYVLNAIDDKTYNYTTDQNFVNKFNKDMQSEEDVETVFSRYIHTINATELVFNNPKWVFRKNNIRPLHFKERLYRDHSATIGGIILNDIPDGIYIASIEKELNSLTDFRFKGDDKILRKSNKAIIRTVDPKGIGLYNTIIPSSKLNKEHYIEDDVVSIIIEGNAKPNYKIIDKVMRSGAKILTADKSIRRQTRNRTTLGSENISGEEALALHLYNNNYNEVENGMWIKNQTIKLHKESRILMPNEYKSQSKKASKKVLISLIQSVSKVFPNVKIEMVSTNEIMLDPNLGEAYSISKGFVKDGIVYFNTDKMTLDTPIHEFGHLYIETIKVNDPDLYKQIMHESLRHELASSIKETYPELKGDALAEEIFVTALGLDNQNKAGRLYKFIEGVRIWWKNLLSTMFKIPSKKVEEITLNDSLNTIIDKLGHKMVFGSEILSSITTEDHQLSTLSKKKNMSYVMIENNLIEQGFIKKICTF